MIPGICKQSFQSPVRTLVKPDLWRKNIISQTPYRHPLRAPPPQPSSSPISNHLTAQKTRIQNNNFLLAWMRTTMKLKWKLFFLSLFPISPPAPNNNTHRKRRKKKNNKLLTILQQQFASHWHKSVAWAGMREGGRESARKIWKIVISYHRLLSSLGQIEFELNISSWSQWNGDLIFLAPHPFEVCPSIERFLENRDSRKPNLSPTRPFRISRAFRAESRWREIAFDFISRQPKGDTRRSLFN